MLSINEQNRNAVFYVILKHMIIKLYTCIHQYVCQLDVCKEHCFHKLNIANLSVQVSMLLTKRSCIQAVSMLRSQFSPVQVYYDKRQRDM